LRGGLGIFGIFGGQSAHEVAANAYFGLDGGAAAEDYVLSAVELGFAGYFVAGVGFDVVAFWLGGGGFGGHCGVDMIVVRSEFLILDVIEGNILEVQ